MRPSIMLQKSWSHSIAEDWTHDIQILVRNIILNMKQSQPGQSGQQIIKIINVGHHLVDNIHNQASMILKKVMQRILVISMNLANNQDPELNPYQHIYI